VECKDGKPVRPIEENSGSTFGDLYQRNAVTLKDLHNKVTVSSSSILISSHQPSRSEVVVTNNFDGPVTLSLELSAAYPGFKASLERQKLEPGQTALVQMSYDPPSPALNPDFVCGIRVMPLNQVIPIAIRFAVPPPEAQTPVPAPKN
jgi:hypothetical protein